MIILYISECMLFIWTLICFYKPFLFIFLFSVFIFFCIRIYAHATRFKWFCFFLLDPTGSASTEEISLWWQRTGTYWCLSYKLTHLSNHYYFLLKQLYLKCDVMNLHYFFHTWQLYFSGLHGRCEYRISVLTQAHTTARQSRSEMQVRAPKCCHNHFLRL